MKNLFKKLFWEKDIFERAKKVGVEIGSSDGIDYETFCKRGNDSEDSLRSRQTVLISVMSLLISIVSLIISIFW